MYKTLGAYLILLFLTGCSISRKLGDDAIYDADKADLNIINSENLTNNSFFIQRADIELVSSDSRQSILASIKFNKPDTFLISLRSKAGIEAARFFLTKDTLLINDRINKILYCGTGSSLQSRFGYDMKFIYVLFGCLIGDFRNSEELICEKGEVYKTVQYDGFKIIYLINCKLQVLKSAEIILDKEDRHFLINYYERRRISRIGYYKRFEISGIQDFNLVKLEIIKIDAPNEGKIEFIPGRNFEQVKIK